MKDGEKWSPCNITSGNILMTLGVVQIVWPFNENSTSNPSMRGIDLFGASSSLLWSFTCALLPLLKTSLFDVFSSSSSTSVECVVLLVSCKLAPSSVNSEADASFWRPSKDLPIQITWLVPTLQKNGKFVASTRSLLVIPNRTPTSCIALQELLVRRTSHLYTSSDPGH